MPLCSCSRHKGPGKGILLLATRAMGPAEPVVEGRAGAGGGRASDDATPLSTGCRHGPNDASTNPPSSSTRRVSLRVETGLGISLSGPQPTSLTGGQPT